MSHVLPFPRLATTARKCFALTALLVALFGMNAAWAQSRTLKGTVLDAESGEALVGATVVVFGNAGIGAIADQEGKFVMNLPEGAKSLLVSYIGYERMEVSIGTDLEITIRMKNIGANVSEVVITALGVAREEKALGYAIQKVDGDQLTQARETNLVNALAGKVAGVQVVGTPSGVGGSARVTIRGDKSLNINKNEPLFVVDGVPILNDRVSSSGRGRQDADYGNPAAVVNPDDIESITVLKGANASALYGSRANNGVILITTKTGKGTRGIGVSVNSTTSFETPLVLPEYQNVYGQGLNGQFGFVNGSGGGLRDGVDESWGPKFEGQLIPQYDSPRRYISNGQLTNFRGGDINAVDENGNLVRNVTEIVPTPWVALPNNVRDFFEVGKTFTNNFAIAGGNEASNFRLSFTNLNQTGIVPNTDLRRNTVAFAGGIQPTKKLSVRTVINYIKSESDNRPNNSYGTENIMYLFNCWLGRQQNMVGSDRDYWQRGLEGRQQFASNYNYHDNPYFNLFENTNGLAGDRVFGNIILKYNFTDWLSLQLRTATDYNYELRTRRRAFSTQRFPFGSYGEERVNLEERNSDFLLTASETFGDFSISGSFGGNRMDRRTDYLETYAGQLLIPGIYNFGNSRIELQNTLFQSRKRINSLYGFTQLAWRNSLFLDLTARNDWSSTLPDGANSYFYPSASFSAVVSDLVKLPEWFSFAKFRAGVAQVGNDTDPFSLQQTFVAGNPFGANRVYSEPGNLLNANLKPEISTSLEVGADLRFLNGRIGLDVTYYDMVSRNQIIGIPLSITTGYSERLINAGAIRNYGLEAMLNLVAVKKEGLVWDIDFNFSMNRSEVQELTDGINNFVMASRYVTVEARVGERMGSMYGFGYQRVTDENSPYFGEKLLDSRGRPIRTTERVLLGNYNPDFLLGINNSLTFKGINLGFLFDIRQGGQVYSHTQTVGREGGQIIETLEGRANGYDLTLPENGVYFDGVFTSTGPGGEKVYTPNDPASNPNAIKLSAREYHSAITLGRSLIEDMIFDASFIKLREVRLGYTIPNTAMGKLPFRNVNVSFVGRNLMVWSRVPHIDPENASVSGGTLIPGVESVSIPSARSFGFNLNFKL